jgi:hypothetical protein
MSDQDVWIEVTSAGQGMAAFCSVAAIHYPYGMSGPSEVRVRFNLSAYVRHEIAKALNQNSEAA